MHDDTLNTMLNAITEYKPLDRHLQLCIYKTHIHFETIIIPLDQHLQNFVFLLQLKGILTLFIYMSTCKQTNAHTLIL
jgi:hypothetical protein